MIELEAGQAFVSIDPEAGGRIAQIEVGEVALLKDDRSGGAMIWGCYPMVPWAGRVRHGRFEFDGQRVQRALQASGYAVERDFEVQAGAAREQQRGRDP